MAVRVSAPAAGDRSAPASAGADLCVVHLARHANGIEPFQRFLDCYRRHPAGIEHELAILLKGFPDPQASEPYRRLAGEACAHWLEVPDDGFDLGAYRRAALALGHRRIAFLNSFSVIRADRWLEMLGSLADAPGVGAVGASGSWGSHSSHVRYDLGLGGPYRRVFADRESTHRVFAGLASGDPGDPGPGETGDPGDPAPEPAGAGGLRGRFQRSLHAAQGLVGHTLAFPAFPAPHLRSNALLIERELWLAVCESAPPDKLAAHRFESGRRGLSARLARRGLRVLVGGSDGNAYEAGQWPASRTFWQGQQENLLVADNQTLAYERGSDEVRRVLSGYAWGPHADPARAGLEVAA
jgi:hypothetical protein